MTGTTREFARALSGAQRGEAEGFTQLWRCLNPALLRYLRVTAGGLAKVVASATWVQAAEAVERFPVDEPAFRALLVRIARDQVTARRGGARRGPVVAAGLIPGDECADPADAAIQLVRLLPPDVAEMVALRVAVGLSTDTVAEVVGVRPGAVRVAVQRGLRRTADALTGAPAGASGLLDPWALDRILDEGEVGVSRLDPAMRSLVAALTSPADEEALSSARAAQRAFARNAHRTRGFAPVAVLGLFARRLHRAGSLLSSKGVAVAVGTVVLCAPAAVASSVPTSSAPAPSGITSTARAPGAGAAFVPFPRALPSRSLLSAVAPAPPSSPPTQPTVAHSVVTTTKPRSPSVHPTTAKKVAPKALRAAPRRASPAASPTTHHRHRRHRPILVIYLTLAPHGPTGHH